MTGPGPDRQGTREPFLEGFRVLDLSQYLPGPFASQMLADLGAEVVKIEPPQGDPMRTFLGTDDDGVSPFYKQVNAGKSIIRLDLKSPEGQEVFRHLASQADVLLESFRPGVMARLGFSGEQLRTLNPGLVHCALSGFGQGGPRRLRAGHDLSYLALTGSLHLTGTGATPTITFPPVADHAGAMQAASGILAALVRRGRTGQGTFIDVSLFESALAWQSIGLAAASRADFPFCRGTSLLTGGAACYQVYRTLDERFVVLAAIEDKFWQAFCATAKRPEWLNRQHEKMPQTNLIREVADLFASRSLAAWIEAFCESDCCFEPVLTHLEAAADPHVLERKMVRQPNCAEDYPEILYPAWIDSQPPPTRQPLAEISVESVLNRWRA